MKNWKTNVILAPQLHTDYARVPCNTATSSLSPTPFNDTHRSTYSPVKQCCQESWLCSADDFLMKIINTINLHTYLLYSYNRQFDVTSFIFSCHRHRSTYSSAQQCCQDSSALFTRRFFFLINTIYMINLHNYRFYSYDEFQVIRKIRSGEQIS